jgi:hypothetical protein
MSNFLAPATVTAALQVMLNEGINAEPVAGIPGTPGVTVGPPNAVSSPDQPNVNIFLYQVIPNTHWRNHDLPTRNARGQLVQNPRAAIDMHYLLTFFGSEAELEPQRLMGSVVHLLNDVPVLTPPHIQAVFDSGNYPFLAESDLANEIERVKFTPIAYSLEELSKLWSVFVDTPYRLSIAYSASLVFVEAGQSMPTPLPVLERQVSAIPSALAAVAPTPDLIDGLALWLVSDREIGFDVDGVSVWNDLSGNDNHATQGTAAFRPAFVAHGLGRRPVLRWDGADDRLDLSLTLIAPLGGLTVALVARMASDDSQLAVTFGGFAELRVSDGGDPPFPTWQTRDTTTTPDTLPADRGVSDTNWHALVGRYSATGAGNNKQLYIDGKLVGERLAHGGNSLGSGNVQGQLTATSGSAPAGDVAELVIYDRALTDEERQQLELYFANRYG